MRLLTALFLISLIPRPLPAQKLVDSTGIANTDIDNKTLDKLSNSYTRLNASLNKQSLTLLGQMQKKEASLRNGMQSRDSIKAQQLFSTSESEYKKLETKLRSPISNPTASLKNYIPGIDSMQTAIQFLNNTGLPTDKIQKLQAISQQLKQLQGSFQNAGDLQDFVAQREAQLNQYGLGNQLSGMNKEAFYYQQQITQYKAILSDHQKQEQLVLSAFRQLPAFQSFWQKNSMLAQLFPAPGNSGTLLAGAGLQTSAQVGGIIQKKLGTEIDDGGLNASQYLHQQVGQAQGQMDQLKNKLDQLKINGGGNSNMTMPDFTPNGQKKKSFFKRLEYSFATGSNNATSLLPAISTLGLSVGYKLSDKATIGVGMNYLLGLGNSFNHIQFSNQGAGLRAFMDIKAKGSIWITGGYEYDYMQQFTNIKSIENLDVWQKSALIGLMKKYSVAKKSGNIQLLYNLLANQAMPRVQPFIIRFGFFF